MGYACPVCDTPQSDGEHLANHLAFTAMLGDDDHATWLDEHAPDWEDAGPDELAPRVTDHVEEADYPQVFDDTRPPESKRLGGGNQHGQHGHDDQHGPGSEGELEDELRRAGGYGRDAGAPQDPEAQRIVAEARRMTEEMLDDGENEAGEGESATEERSGGESGESDDDT